MSQKMFGSTPKQADEWCLVREIETKAKHFERWTASAPWGDCGHLEDRNHSKRTETLLTALFFSSVELLVVFCY